MYKILEEFIERFKLSPSSSQLSTSTHFINGDSNLDQTQVFMYLLLNYMNNVDDIESLGVDKDALKNTSIEDFKISEDLLRSAWSGFDKGASPSRKVGDLFWSTLDWKKYKDIKILDIGCGSGGYAKKIYEWSQGNMKSYSGFDVFPNAKWNDVSQWGKQNNVDIEFSKINIDENNIKDFIPKGTNFFISQSALEHLKYDLKYFQGVRSFIDSVDYPVTQVHIFPGSASLKLFLLHGYRQYGLNSIAKIIRIFRNEKVRLVRMCGNSCNDLHYNFITKPVYIDRTKDKRETETELYDKLLFDSIVEDMKQEIKDPCFWAMIIESNK